MSASANFGKAAAATAFAVGQTGGDFRGIGAAAGKSLSGIGSDISNSLQTGGVDVQKAVGDKLQRAMPNNLYKNIKIAPGTSIPDLVKIVKTGDKDGLTQALQSITGINVRDDLHVPSNVSIEKRVDNFLNQIKTQVIQEIKDCIARHLQALRNKHEILDILLDLEGYIQRKINRARLELQRKIRAAIEKEIMQNLGIWQISQMRQKILALIRKICPDTHSRGAKSSISPALSRKFQTDPTWEIVDGVTPISELAKNVSATHSAHYSDPDSTGAMVENTANNIMVQVKQEALNQGQGFSNASVSDFVSEDGTIDSTYINSAGEIVDAADVASKIDCT
jgi:hypothetical protein